MAKIGDVEVLVTSESLVMINEVTQRRVEMGTLTDNVKALPDGIDLSGTVTSDGWAKINKLREYRDNGTLLTYTGKGVYKNMVIEAIDVHYESGNEYGFDFDAELTEVRIARTRMVDLDVAEDIQNQIKQITDAGLQTLRGG